ncbi:MAG: FMN-dependent L-lactate dehydrogenase LldD [Alphaproteobacteria bacterium]|nr:FMN-dependent L-lactate dehydrogenase LldD [Alphaproteobacteria bacterium]MDE2112445.1 FMN-dependent L-lactate dehydrogenase LldD [Alphaproteobacteria bacterium]MDE2494052.1 FMN-dependent L-lactate dehydrogenase LldD [Alphaproteobacteria bacterium]
MIAASIQDYRELARTRLPRFLFEYADGGAYAEETLRRNVTDLRSVVLKQRVLRDVSAIELSTRLLGMKFALPVALGPIGLAGMYARRGEVQAARAAEAKGVPFTLSTVGACSIGEVCAGAKKPFWFQLYMMRDRAFMRDLLALADEAKCSALVFTVDMPIPGTRYRDYHSGLAGAAGWQGQIRHVLQAMIRPGWAWDVGVLGGPHTLGNVAPILRGKTGIEDFFAWMRANFDPSVTWDDLAWVRDSWKGPLIVKGVLDPEDANMAAKIGADGIVVSNHGGRQLDGVLATARALPAIAERLRGSKLVIFADGGVRSGLDVVRMLALGAQAVLLGRAWIYALGASGQGGVEHVLDLIESEMRVAMALTGITRVCDINSEILA